MKRNALKALLALSVLVFLVGCTPAANETTQADDMQKEEKASDEKDMKPKETAEENSSEGDKMEDSTHGDDTASDDKSEDAIKDDDMKIGEMEAMSEYKDLTPAEAKELIDNTPNLVIIDVSPKYDAGHLPGAINYYVGDGSLDNAIPSLDKTMPYLVYCHVDSASIAGAQKLIDAGFPMVYRLEGNYSAWVDAGYDIEK